jgi:hypothetical protein
MKQGSNGFFTRLVPKLQITRGVATRDLQFGHHGLGVENPLPPFPAIQK